MVPNSRINLWKSWFIFNLRKINIGQYCKSSLRTWNNHNQTRILDIRLQTTHDNFFLRYNYAIITSYILERPSSWSTSRICPSWPQSRVRLSLLLALFHKYPSCLFWPTQYLAICSNDSCFTLKLSLASWAA
jgi:hypothetical protein